MPNILFTSAGRRGALIRIFQRELQSVFPDGKVFATDLNPDLSSACQIADGWFSVPRVTDESYIPKLIEICCGHDINLVIPTIDHELLLLAEHRDRLNAHGVTPLISDTSFVRACRDKRLTIDLFQSLNLDAPALFDPHKLTDQDFPLFAKPYNGSSSINTHLLQTARDLTPTLLADPTLIYMEYLTPAEHDEYTVDMYYDRQGHLKCLVPRLRIETRAGEISKGRTTWLPEFDELRQRMACVDGARGCLTAQFFRHRESKRLSGIEINPRFGGGYPLSYDAGANYAGFVIDEYLCDRPVEWFDRWERNLTMLRYDDHVLVRRAAA